MRNDAIFYFKAKKIGSNKPSEPWSGRFRYMYQAKKWFNCVADDCSLSIGEYWLKKR